MKNFPNQYSDFAKLRGSLATVRDLLDAREDVENDDVLGYELARRGVYTFRGLVGSVPERIAAERRKPPRSQGARTAARETRRTLAGLGWLDGGARLTEAGRVLLATPERSEAERVALQQALLDLRIASAEGVSHPVRILLRLVADHAIVQRRGMELVLEAHDDSEAEYRRISALFPLTPEERLERLGVTITMVANAVKIFPRLAEQAGLIVRDGQTAPYRLTEAGRAALGEGFAARRVDLAGAALADPPASARPRPAASRASGGARARRGLPREISGAAAAPGAPAAPEEWASLSREEQIAATRLRFERTARHERMLGRLIELRRGGGASLLEDRASFDLLEVPPDAEPLTLYELKTLESDELTQTRLAIGQLLSYEHLNVRPRWPGRDVRRVAVFETPVDEDLAGLLERLGIAAFALLDGALTPLNEAAAAAGLA